MMETFWTERRNVQQIEANFTLPWEGNQSMEIDLTSM